MAAPKEQKYDANECIMNGYLEKQSVHLKQFRKRWMVLKGNCLYSFKTHKDEQLNDAKPTEIINLSLFICIRICNKTQFELLSDNQKTKRAFVAKSNEDRDKWLHCIKNIHSIKIIMNPNCDVIKIDINIVNSKQFNDNFVIYASYLEQEKIERTFKQIRKYLNEKHHPIKLAICKIKNGFIENVCDELDEIGYESMTMYNKQQIIDKGLSLSVSGYILTEYAQTIENIKPLIKINITIENSEPFNDFFAIHAVHSMEEKIENIVKQITKYLNKKYHPIKLTIVQVKDGFAGFVSSWAMNKFLDDSIREWERYSIEKKGLFLSVMAPAYEHKIISESVTCPYINKLNSNDPLHCPIYYGMKQNYEFNKNNLSHLNEFTHFMDEYGSKPQCKYNNGCKAFIRMENGGNEINDQCHIKLYRHPPRTRNIELSKNTHLLVINKERKNNHPLYKPTNEDKKKYNFTDSDGFLNALINEVKSNGFEYDLCLECSKNDECKHNCYSLLQIVDDKMDHIRHKSMDKPLNRGQMLSLTLYTGCDCNYDLCASQRSGNYNKWKWFDYCLWNAIHELSLKETGSYSVFSGLSGVHIDAKEIKKAYFVTYISTSWKKEIAETFMNDNGMIIQIDKQFKEWVTCCDVSWISKFPDESEILFARSLEWDAFNDFTLSVIDVTGGIQRVSLERCND